MQTTPTARLVVFGEALTDLIRTGENTWLSQAGGAGWNIARVAARLGLPTGFAGAISNDCFGDELYQQSIAAGLDLRFLQRSDKNPFLAIVHETHPPAYFFVGNDSADCDFKPEQLPSGWQDGVEIAHFGSLGLVREPLATQLLELAISLKQAGVKISYDPNWRKLMGPEYLARFEIMLGLADYVKLSDEDLVHLMPDTPVEIALNQVCIWAGQASILYTQGANGLQLIEEGRKQFVPANKVNVIDTVGAGDASMGGWLTSLLMQPQASSQDHARFAAASAAIACQYAGAFAPTLSEVQTLLKENT
ncbi:carbohydrate kinase [Iodobacter sp. CM08]|uniref:carbohydrate kinase family protein n=1 Tax=Iodobacter sp. CM08 TaxID=3085902 RepID=UPI0029824A6F|nr:carbohydrate kinase [Iodobacter sp. CM08]MDW5415798.1 carbohydrate kinase [Iodobacter sp. CM08]